jgi:RimJ/RimL family protein N-acetyltransferase
MSPRLDPAAVPWVLPATLEGERVRLEPLSMAHLDGLAAVGLEPAIWRFMPIQPRSIADLQTWLETALRNAAAGLEVPFATIDRRTGRPIGSTRYMAIVPEHRRLEIGWTWLGREHQGTLANKEAKRLQLEHAFQTLGANRVELKTDADNARSRAALLSIGARFEGVARNHMLAPGRIRHSAWYSVTIEDWPEVDERLRLAIGDQRLPSSNASTSSPRGGAT